MQIQKVECKNSKKWIPLDLQKVFFVVLHHADAEQAPPEQIDKWHLERFSGGFGYNFYIRKDGTIHEGRGFNIGAQTENMNSKSIGVCFEGNFDRENMGSRQLSAGIMFIRDWLMPKLPNKVEVVPHSRFQPTACPGAKFPMAQLVSGLTVSQLDKDVNVLAMKEIINSPGFWIHNAVKGKEIDGQYAALLINRMAEYIRKR